jgi:WD40 repeat protein
MSAGAEARTEQLPDRPYVGLDNYSEEFAAVFFGRRSENDALIGSFRASRFMLLYAQSGVGKSSLLRAGVVPRLREVAAADMEEGEPPRYVPAVCGSWDGDAVELVRQSIVDTVAAVPFRWESAADDLPRDDLEAIVESVTTKLDSTLLLVFDQFEEYFRHQGEQARAAFADAVGRCVRRADLRVNFLISIREDAYASLGNLFKGRVPNVYGSYLNLAPLGVEDAELAIRKPLEKFGAGIKDDLVEAVLKGVTEKAPGQNGNGSNGHASGGGPFVATPYLQLVMETLWKQETTTGENGGKLLTLDTLERLEGTEKIIQRHVSRAMDDLDEGERKVAAAALRYLAPSDRGKLTLTVDRLAYFTGKPADALRRVLDHLDRWRIVKAPTPDGYEIFHDVLATHIIAWRTRFEREQQTKAERDERNKRVAAERREAEEREAKLHQERRARLRGRLFIGAVVVAAVAIGVILWQAAENQRERSTSRRLAADALGYPPIELSSLYALEARKTSNTVESRQAIMRLADNHELGPPLPGPDRITGVAVSPKAGLVATASDGLTRDGTRFDGSVRIWALNGLRDLKDRTLVGSVIAPHSGAINGVSFSPDGKTLATAGGDGSVRLWDLTSDSHGQIAEFKGEKTAPVNTVAFSPSGRFVASGSCFKDFHEPSTDTVVRLWNVEQRRLSSRLVGQKGGVCGVAFGANDRQMATGDDEGTVTLWDLRSRYAGRIIATGHTGAINELRFSPDGKRLASGGADETVRVWDVEGNRRLGKPLTGHAGVITGLAFSPDGTTLASVARDRTLRLWDLETQEELGEPFQSHSAAVMSVAFADADTLVSGGRDGARVWNVAGTREFSAPIEADPAGVVAVAVSRDGKLAWSGLGGQVGIWDMRQHHRIARFKAPTDNVNSIAFSPNGKTLVWAADTKPDAVPKDRAYVQGWNLVTRKRFSITPVPPQQKGTPTPPIHKVRALGFSPDGKLVAFDEIAGETGQTERGSVRIWDLRTRRFRPGPTHPLEGHAIAFSPDSKTLALAADRGVTLWDVDDGRVIDQLRAHKDFVFGAAFSPDGTKLATASRDGAVILWDVAERRQIGVPMLRRTTVYSVAFSPDGKTLAAAGDDHLVQLWDVATHRPLGAPVAGHKGTVFGVAFSPDGRTLASGSIDGDVRVWRNYPLESAVNRLCTYIDQRSAERTWKQLEPSVDFHDPC